MGMGLTAAYPTATPCLLLCYLPAWSNLPGPVASNSSQPASQLPRLRRSDVRVRRSPPSLAVCLRAASATGMAMEMEMEDTAVPALAVVDARFCAADAASLAVAKALSMSGSDFAVTDEATGALVLRVDGVLFSLRRRCVLVDADRRPVLTVQESVSAPSPLRSSFP